MSAATTNPLAKLEQMLGEIAQQGPGGSVELLLRQLAPEEAQALRLCAIPHEFDAQLLRALVPELSNEEARRRCTRFAELSMVTLRGEKLTLHEEARRHLFEKWLQGNAEAQEKFRAASRQLVAYFENEIARLQQAGATEDAESIEDAERVRMFHLLGAAPHDGLEEFERLCRKRRAQLRYSECETLLKLVHEYDLRLSGVERAIVAYHEAKLAADRNKWTLADKLFHQVLETDGVPLQLKVKTHCRLGIINDEQRRWEEAKAAFKTGLQLANGRSDCAAQIVHLHLNLGSTYRNAGELETAEQFLSKGIELAHAGGSASSQADGYNSLGTLYRKLGDSRRAIEAYEKSLHFLSEYGEGVRRAQVYNNLGNVYADEREWEKSEKFLRQSLEIKRQAGDTGGQARTLTNLIRIHRRQDRPECAIEAAQQAIALFQEGRDEFNVAVAKQKLGGIYRALGRKELAGAAFQEAAEIFERCEASEKAAEARAEKSRLERRFSLPWWMVVGLVLFALLVYLFVLALRQ